MAKRSAVKTGLRTGIKEIVLEVQGRELRMTLEAARELKEALGEILGEEKHVHHYDYWRWPTWWYTQPISSDPPYRVTWGHFDSTTGGTVYNGSTGNSATAVGGVIDTCYLTAGEGISLS